MPRTTSVFRPFTALVGLVLATQGFSLVLAGADQVKTLDLGASAPDFDLPGVDDKSHRLADFVDSKLLVVIFTCNHCPTAQAYEDRIIQLWKDYHKRGVALVAISPNDPKAVRLDELGYTDVSDSLAEMKLRAKAKNFPFPYLYDGETQQVSRAYGVRATPHVFVFDTERRLRYVGRIDDSDTREPKSHDTRNAIDSLLAGRPVAVKKTRTFGCSTKWSSKKESARSSVEKWDREPVALEPVDAATIRKLVTAPSDKYRLVKVWATWCGSCVTEFPEFVTIHRMYRRRNFEAMTICIDRVKNREAALETLRAQHVSSKNYIFSSDDHDALAEALDGEWDGPIPYCVLIGPGGKIVYRHTGPIDPLEVKRAIVERLGRTYR